MEIYYDENEPFDFVIPLDASDIIGTSDIIDSYDIVNPVGYDMGHALYTNGYPELQLSQFNDLTHDIYYYWNGFDDAGRSAVLNNFNNFHPLDNILFDRFNSWDDIDRYWYIPNDYLTDGYLSVDGWSRGYALLAYMKAVSDKYLKKHVKNACESRDKVIAKAIWYAVNNHFNTPNYVLTANDIQDIRNKDVIRKSSYTNITDQDIQDIFTLMNVCHRTRKNITATNIEKFLKKVCKEGIKNAANTFKKYLLLKNKYSKKKSK